MKYSAALLMAEPVPVSVTLLLTSQHWALVGHIAQMCHASFFPLFSSTTLVDMLGNNSSCYAIMCIQGCYNPKPIKHLANSVEPPMHSVASPNKYWKGILHWLLV